jgi:hypothetical protein
VILLNKSCLDCVHVHTVLAKICETCKNWSKFKQKESNNGTRRIKTRRSTIYPIR